MKRAPQDKTNLNRITQQLTKNIRALSNSSINKLIPKRLKLIIEKYQPMPSNQFGFRSKDSAIDQVHTITGVREESFEQKQVCSAIFWTQHKPLTEYGMTACYTN
jgi:hypothetical protein